MITKIKKYEIWLANLDPRIGTEPGKTRPVLIVQTDILNKIHPKEKHDQCFLTIPFSARIIYDFSHF
jgi:hypothetical protein